MIDSHVASDAHDDDETPEASTRRPGIAADGKRRKSLSMHDGIAVWCDCCSCEAEPYWVAVAEELGIDLGSDYEDADTKSSQND